VTEILTPSEWPTCAALAAYESAIMAGALDEELNARRLRYLHLNAQCRAERRALGLETNPGRLARAASLAR
jgi:hypothetical protein